MEWKVKRVKTMWDHVDVTPPSKPAFRVNRFNETMVYHEVELADLSLIPDLFSEVQSQLRGRCQDLQLFFDGPFPREQLESLGFDPSKGESRIWNKPHTDYRVSAIRIDSSNSWILEVMKRTGRGVLSDAARLEFLTGTGKFHLQLALPLDPDVIAS